MNGPDPRPLRAAGLSTAALPYARKAPPPPGWERWCTTWPTDEEMVSMFGDGDKHNIAVPCGPASGGIDIVGEPYTAGLIVLVFNNRRFFEGWTARHADVVRWTWVAESFRGPHMYLRLRDELPPRTLYWNAGPSFPSILELRTTGAYVVGPESLHPKGVFYTWCEPRPPEIRALELDEFRDWFREGRYRAAEDGWHLRLGPGGATERGQRRDFAEQIKVNVPRILPDEVRGPADAGQSGGERHFTLVSLAGTMRRRGLTAAEIEAGLLEVNAQRCKPPCPERDVKRIAQSVARYDPNEVPAESDISFDVETRPRLDVRGAR